MRIVPESIGYSDMEHILGGYQIHFCRLALINQPMQQVPISSQLAPFCPKMDDAYVIESPR